MLDIHDVVCLLVNLCVLKICFSRVMMLSALVVDDRNLQQSGLRLRCSGCVIRRASLCPKHIY